MIIMSPAQMPARKPYRTWTPPAPSRATPAPARLAPSPDNAKARRARRNGWNRQP